MAEVKNNHNNNALIGTKHLHSYYY